MPDDMNKPEFLEQIEFEDDPEIIAEGEEKLHQALQIMSMHADPAFSFVMYRFNRAAIKHEKLDAILYLDKTGAPTLGINYERFNKMTPLAQIGAIEHQVGHLMSGHLGDRLGYEMRNYCEFKYGEKMGRQIYYLSIEMIADMFVTYPGAVKDAGRPYYDIRKLGLKRWEYTLNAMKRVEELLDPGDKGFQPGQPPPELQDLMDQLAQKLRNSSSWQNSDKADKKPRNIGGIPDDGDTSEDPDNDGMDDESGGLPVKDLLFVPDKEQAMMAESKTREIVTQAIEQTRTDKSRGFLGGDLSQFIESASVQPVVPWYQRLNHAITSGISMERRITKRRLNRRNPDFGFGRLNENVTVVCFVIDTSGSMGADELSHVDAELAAIVQNTENPVQVIHCDAGVAKCEEYRHGMKMEQFWGRGGTTFDPALEYIRDELDQTPDLICYFTDGYGGKLNDDEPIIHPSMADLIWILTPSGMDEGRFRESITEQGEVIKVEEWT